MLTLRKVNFRVVSSVLRNHMRGIQSNDSLLDECNHVRNRNPRSLESLRIAKKHRGWTLEKTIREYYYKLVFSRNSRFITLELHHFENGPIISVSTREMAIKKQLEKLNDKAAYINVGRVMAQRCLESGITSMLPMSNETNNSKLNALLETLKESGLILEEAPQLKNPEPWDKKTEEKPWDIFT